MGNNRVILVTGGCGYLGSQLIRDFFREEGGAELTVRVLDNLDAGSPRALMDLPREGNYQLFEGDILNPAVVEAALQDVDVVIHLAAIVHTPMGYENPTWVEQVNHWGTSRLVEACLACDVSRFIYASSVAVYGPKNAGDEVAHESDLCKPVGPYARSKYHAERSVLAASERGLAATILRFGILYGYAPVIRFDAVANRFAYLAGVNRPLTIHGHGEQKRSFVHVCDASEAIRVIVNGQVSSGDLILNVIGHNASVLEVAEAVRVTQSGIEMRYTDQDVQTRFDLVADNSKITDLGWSPNYTLKAGLEEIIRKISPFRPMHVPGHLD